MKKLKNKPEEKTNYLKKLASLSDVQLEKELYMIFESGKPLDLKELKDYARTHKTEIARMSKRINVLKMIREVERRAKI
jgi:acetyl-CoA carboxylase alpha subunit